MSFTLSATEFLNVAKGLFSDKSRGKANEEKRPRKRLHSIGASHSGIAADIEMYRERITADSGTTELRRGNVAGFCGTFPPTVPERSGTGRIAPVIPRYYQVSPSRFPTGSVTLVKLNETSSSKIAYDFEVDGPICSSILIIWLSFFEQERVEYEKHINCRLQT